MSFFDRAGDFFKKTGGGIGAAWSAAGGDKVDAALKWAFTTDVPGTSGLHPAEANIDKAAFWPVKAAAQGAAGGLEKIGQGLGYAYSYGAARPISTLLQQQSWAGLMDQNSWTTAWHRSRNISPGQAFTINADQIVNESGGSVGPKWTDVDNDPFGNENAANRQEYFKNTAAGRLSSGSVDFLMNWYADPTVLAGKLHGVNKLATTTVAKGDVAEALERSTPKGQEAAAAAGKSTPKAILKPNAANAADRLSQLYSQTDNLSAAEMVKLPQFAKTQDGGVLAYFFDRANKSFPGETEAAIQARHQVKASIIGIPLGDTDAIARLKARDGVLADELKRAGDTVVPFDANNAFSWDDNGQAMLNFHNAQDDAGWLAQKDAIEKERVRLGRLMDLQGGSNKVGATGAENLVSKLNTNKITESLVPSGLFGRPIRTIMGSSSSRVPGWIHTKDPSRGYDDLASIMQQMKHTSPADRKALMNSWTKAATDGERRNVISAVEAKMFEDTASKYGVSTDAAKTLLQKGQDRAQAYIGVMKQQLYSALDTDQIVKVTDPEDDITHAFNKPLLQTQLENATMITDPRVLDRALAKGTNQRLLEQWARKVNAQALGTKLADMEDGASDALDDWATMFTRPWKDLALMRGAYPIRIQADTQMRSMAYMGMVQYVLSRAKVVTGTGKFFLTDPEGAVSVKNLFKSNNIGAATESQFLTNSKYKGFDIAPAQTADDVRAITDNIASSGGAAADMGNDIQSAIAKNLRGSGSWGRVETNDPGWFENWKRAVDQIKSSPVARRALADQDVDSLAKWVDETPAARKEWLEFSDSEPDLKSWVAKVIAHANHYLPSDDLRGIILKDDVLKQGPMDAEKAASITTDARRDKAGMAVDAAMQQHNDLKPIVDQAQKDYEKARKKYRQTQKAYSQARGKPPRAATTLRAPSSKAKATPATIVDNPTLKKKRAALAQAKKEHTAARKNYFKLKTQHAANLKTAKTAEQVNRDVLSAQDEFELPRDFQMNTYKDAQTYFASKEGQANRMVVHGESYSPLDKGASKVVGKWWQSVRKHWYDIAADMPETVMGRSPIYAMSFKKYMKDAIDRLDTDTLSLEDVNGIRRSAHKAAAREVSNVLFDTSDASNLSHSMRHLSPFFSAWEDTMYKWGKLIANDPSVGVRLTQAWSMPNDLGMTVDSEGNSVDQFGNLIDPDTGKLMKAPKGYPGKGQFIVLPKSVGGWAIPGGGKFRVSKTSMNILFQGNPPWLPGPGPLVEMPVNYAVAKSFPEAADNPVIKYILPFGPTGGSVGSQLVDQTMPSWAKQLKTAFSSGSQDYANTYAMLLAEEYTKYQNGQRKAAPSQDEIAGKTRNWYLLRAALNNVAPVTMTPTPEMQLYIDKSHEYKAKYGINWEDKFYQDFPQYFNLSISLSQNNTGLQATNQVYDALKNKSIRKAVQNNPELGWFYAGPANIGGTFNSSVYNWEQNTTAGNGQKFISQKSPKEALDQIQSEKGWMQYDKATKYIQQQLESRGLHSIQQKGAEDLQAMKTNYVAALAADNRAWYYDYQSRDSSKVQKLVDAAETQWKQDPRFAKRSDQVALKQYLNARTYFEGILQSRKVTGLQNPDNSDVANAWGSYIDELKNSSPAFETMYNRVLESDDISKALLGT